jgi:hypothetical protein
VPKREFCRFNTADGHYYFAGERYRGEAMINSRMYVISILFTMAITAESSWAACTHYASPTGGGSGLSSSSPFKIAKFWPVARPGDTLCLLDGTYRGAESMIKPTNGQKGLAGSPITVRALNDGKVLIDGQSTYQPLRVTNNAWMIFEGMDFTETLAESSVCLLDGGTNNVILRRIICSQRTPGGSPFNLNQTSKILVEDGAFFGPGRRQLANGCCGNNGTTFRRVWVRGGPSAVDSVGGPKAALQPTYRSTNVQIENALVTWDAANTSNNYGLIASTASLSGEANMEIRGTLGYVRCTDTFPSNAAGIYFAAWENIHLRDVIAYIEPGCHTTVRPFLLGNDDASDAGAPGRDLTAQNLLSIGSGADEVHSQWSVVNRQHFSSVAAAPSIFTGSNAKLCKRWNDGVLTTQPLWPWPMNSRIATGLARGGLKPLTGGSVDSEIASIFGPIPAECKTTAAPTPAPTPAPAPIPTPTVDTTPPTVTIVSPANGGVVKR